MSFARNRIYATFVVAYNSEADIPRFPLGVPALGGIIDHCYCGDVRKETATLRTALYAVERTTADTTALVAKALGRPGS